MRLLASLEHYLATTAGDTLYVQQYTGSRLSGADLDLEVTTDYPWSGAVSLRVLAAPAAERGIALRIPAWSPHTRVSVNNVNHDPERIVALPGYHHLRRPSVTAIAIPYFQWDNRDGRSMRVWIPRADA